MNHLTEADILEFDRLDGDRQATLGSHLSACARCREALAAHRDLLAVLGEWQIPNPPEQSAVIRARVAAVSRANGSGWRGWLRVAAAIVIAAGAGYAGGIASRPRPAQAATPEEVSASLHLDDLDGGTSDELAALFENPPEPGSGEEGSR
ncbi:MAG: hypothetical protein ACTHN5_10390 [Phycisphaerae bacterium]